MIESGFSFRVEGEIARVARLLYVSSAEQVVPVRLYGARLIIASPLCICLSANVDSALTGESVRCVSPNGCVRESVARMPNTAKPATASEARISETLLNTDCFHDSDDLRR